jgi:DNA gyrase subunit A
MIVCASEAQEGVLTVCERGYGKRTPLDEFAAKGRGGYGVIAIRTNNRNGPLAGVLLASDDDHLIMISDKGRLIRLRMADVSLMGRSTQGVRIMRLDEGERVASVARVVEPDEKEDLDLEAQDGGSADGGGAAEPGSEPDSEPDSEIDSEDTE